jgi:molybdopterin synthase catalytic subunit/molybdopterin converting factor small subunit
VRVKVLFFGVLKDVLGRAEEVMEIEAGARLETVFEYYAARCPVLRGMGESVLVARNQRFAPRTAPVEDGDEVAFLPPVSGGSGLYTQMAEEPEGHFFALTREPIDAAALRARLVRSADGAAVIFEGLARDNTGGRRTLHLEYDCYEPMALEALVAIGRELARLHPIGRIGIVHRVGRVEVGETIVAIVVTAAHRRPAFEAASEAIDRLKRTVPIWKKEHFADGEAWVEGQWDTSAVRP